MFRAIPFAFFSVIYLVTLGFSIYGFVLFIKLARRGITALDIYINEKSKMENMDPMEREQLGRQE
ncbi:MAG: hypothetical protein CVV03_02245 [Firmicutes bacterium HGW-Firmicutes-8]|nr:MAG: hypothetical protein CVV03_02245 [Firmicutes bacterium HGW-Firmicutes-8]